MALGSSAPEILLNVVEITTGKFMAGALGPSTIVGSAAFNLLVILGVCVGAITEGTRRIEEMKAPAPPLHIPPYPRLHPLCTPVAPSVPHCTPLAPLSHLSGPRCTLSAHPCRRTCPIPPLLSAPVADRPARLGAGLRSHGRHLDVRVHLVAHHAHGLDPRPDHGRGGVRCARCAAIEPVSCMATPGHVRPLPEARGPRPPQADARARLAVCSVITFALFWVLLFAAYACDRDLFRPKKPIAPEDDFEGGAVPGSLVEAGADASDDITVKNALKMGGGMSGLDDMNDDAKVDVILESLKPVTAATHTRNAMSWCVPLPLARLACSPQRGVCSPALWEDRTG